MSDKALQVIETANEQTFARTNLLIAGFCSVESLLWNREDVYDVDFDSCEVAEIVFEDGPEEAAGYNYDLRRLFSNYPLAVQEHLSKCLRCQSRLLELTQRYQRGRLSDAPPGLDRLIETYRQDLKIYANEEFAPYRAALQNNLGNALLNRFEQQGHTEDLHQAISCFDNAGRFYYTVGDRLALATAANNIANAYLSYARLQNRAERVEQAIGHYYKALKLLKQQDCHVHQALVHNNLGNAELERFEFSEQPKALEQALYHYRVALETCQAPQYPLHAALLHRNFGSALLKQYKLHKRISDWEKAGDSYQKALDFFSQHDELAYDAAITRQCLGEMEKIRVKQPRLINEISYLDSTNLGGPTSVYQKSKSYDLGILRLGGLIEARGMISWQRVDSGQAMTYPPEEGVSLDGWKIFVVLQPMLVRSNRLRLALTLPDSESQDYANSLLWPEPPTHHKWTSPWYNLEQAGPVEIEIPDFWHLTQCHELHWQIEETPPSNAREWLSSYLTWDSLRSKLDNTSRHHQQDNWFDSPWPDQDDTCFDPATSRSEPHAIFELINLTEQGIKLEVEGQPLESDRVRLNLRLVSIGVTTTDYPGQPVKNFEVGVMDDEEQVLLPATFLKLGHEQSLEVALPRFNYSEASHLEFKVRLADN